VTRALLVACCCLATFVYARPASAQTTPVVPGAPGPTLEEARKALDAAVATAKKANVTISCAVVDSRGDLIALHRMDNARFITIDIARGKALAAAIFGQPSASLERMANTPWFQNLNIAAQGRLYPAQGGLPIVRNQQTFGAIACSGATGQLDEESARAGLALF
jgi:glc operon protein GlcG